MIFGKSKKALELADAHFTKVFESYRTYFECVAIYLKEGSTPEAHVLFERIDRLEQEADDILADMVRQVQRGVQASARMEIIKICGMVDKIANNVQAISRRMVIVRVFFPEDIRSGLLDIACCTKSQLEALAQVMELLVIDYYEKLALDHLAIEEVKVYEKKIDELERGVLKELFAMDDISLAEKIHAKYFITRMEEVSDLIEDIADAIQMMMVFRKI